MARHTSQCHTRTVSLLSASRPTNSVNAIIAYYTGHVNITGYYMLRYFAAMPLRHAIDAAAAAVFRHAMLILLPFFAAFRCRYVTCFAACYAFRCFSSPPLHISPLRHFAIDIAVFASCHTTIFIDVSPLAY